MENLITLERAERLPILLYENGGELSSMSFEARMILVEIMEHFPKEAADIVNSQRKVKANFPMAPKGIALHASLRYTEHRLDLAFMIQAFVDFQTNKSANKNDLARLIFLLEYQDNDIQKHPDLPMIQKLRDLYNISDDLILEMRRFVYSNLKNHEQ